MNRCVACFSSPQAAIAWSLLNNWLAVHRMCVGVFAPQRTAMKQLQCQRVVEAIFNNPTGMFAATKHEANATEIQQYLDEVLDRSPKFVDDARGADGAAADTKTAAATTAGGRDHLGCGSGMEVESSGPALAARREDATADATCVGAHTPAHGCVHGAALQPGSEAPPRLTSRNPAPGGPREGPYVATPSVDPAPSVSKVDVGVNVDPALLAPQPQDAAGTFEIQDVSAELHEEAKHILDALIAIRQAWTAGGGTVPPSVERALMHIIVCANREAARGEELLVEKVQLSQEVSQLRRDVAQRVRSTLLFPRALVFLPVGILSARCMWCDPSSNRAASQPSMRSCW